MAEQNTVLNARQAAEYLGTHVETVRRLARRGNIPSFKVGADWRFSREALSRWFEAQQSGGDSITVMVIDDDPDVVRSISRTIESLGCRSVRATNGAEGLLLLAKGRPDLIFLDLEMPEMSGPEFLEKLRPLYPNLPVAIVTGYSSGELMYRASQYAPLMLLPKPANPDQIERTIRTVLGDRLRA